MKEEKNLVAKAPEAIPAHLAALANKHDDDFSQNDFSYGWLRITQSMTDQRKKQSEKYIEGLDEGDLFNSMTGDNYGPSVDVVPLKFFRSYREATDEAKSKHVRNIDPTEWASLNLTRKGSRYTGPGLAPGNCGMEQMNYMVFLPQHPEAGILRLAIGPGGFKPATSWNTLLRMKNVPKHFQVWNLATKSNENDQGSFYTIGNGGTFSGKFVRFVTEDEMATITDMVSMVNNAEAQLHKGVEPDDGSDDAAETEF